MERRPLKSDWKTFGKRAPEWRERYLLEKNKEIIAVLSDETKTPTVRFWDAKKKMKEEAKVLTDCLDGHSRSKMQWYLRLMHRHGLLQNSDLVEFSEELREQILTSLRGLDK